jgi:hypothetical protein
MARSAKTGPDAGAAPPENGKVESAGDDLSTRPGADDGAAEGPAEGADRPHGADATHDPAATVPLTESLLVLEDRPAESAEPPAAAKAEPLKAAEPAAPVREPPPQRAPEPQPPARGGVFPLVAGGVIAAGLGYLAAWQGFVPGNAVPPPVAVPEVTSADLEAQAARIGELEAALAALPAPAPESAPAPDLGPLTERLEAVRAEIGPLTDGISTLDGRLGTLATQIADTDARLAALETRLTDVERAPDASGTLAQTAIAGWEAEIAALRDQIAGQDTKLQAIADEAAAKLAEAEVTVAVVEQNAQASAAAELRRAAMTRIQAAMDAGTPFADALGDLAAAGVVIPDALTATAADGVPTLASLAESFPATARAAMATARSEGLADDGEWRIMAFLRSQLDVRSVTPREGSDPDAILSRAEAALQQGHLSDTLAEIGALPEVVRAEMSAWIVAADARVAAQAAVQALSESLPQPSN